MLKLIIKKRKKDLARLIKQTVAEEIQHLSQLRELAVYDFDDTLAHTDSVAFVINEDTGNKREITSEEFHNYNLASNERFDLSDFADISNATTLPHFDKLRADYERLGPSGVAILTARPDPGPVDKFLNMHGISGIEIMAVGIHNPIGERRLRNAGNKKKWLKKQIENRNLEHLSFYDDDAANIAAAEQLIEEFPEVTFNIEQVT